MEINYINLTSARLILNAMRLALCIYEGHPFNHFEVAPSVNNLMIAISTFNNIQKEQLIKMKDLSQENISDAVFCLSLIDRYVKKGIPLSLKEMKWVREAIYLSYFILVKYINDMQNDDEYL